MIVDVLFASLWQGAIVTALLLLVRRCIPKNDAATQYALWYLAMLALLAMPIATVYSHFGASVLHIVRPRSAPGVAFKYLLVPLQEHREPASFGPVSGVLLVWATGALVQFTRLAVSFARIKRLKNQAQPLAGYGRDVRISRDLSIPIAAGVFDPCVILPKSLLQSVEPDDIDRVVAHERAHIRRHDVAANGIQRGIEALLFFNPFAWFIGRQVTFSREAACDDLALGGGDDPESFARCLARLGSLRRNGAIVASPGAIGSRHALVARIERLLAGGSPARTTANAYAIGGTVLVFAIMTLFLQATTSSFASTQHTLASTCAIRNADAAVIKAAPPKLAKPEHGWVESRVTISPKGIPTAVDIINSSGNRAIMDAAAQAAVHSTYSPAIVNCKPVQGSYLFRVDM